MSSPPVPSDASAERAQDSGSGRSRAQVLGIHGLRNYQAAPEVKARRWLNHQWADALRDGLAEVAYPEPESVDVTVAYYAPFLRGPDADSFGVDDEPNQAMGPGAAAEGNPGDTDSGESGSGESGSGESGSGAAKPGESKPGALLAEVREQLGHIEDSELWRSVFARFQGSSRSSSAAEWLSQTAERISQYHDLNATPQERLMLSSSAELAVFVSSPHAREQCRQEVLDLIEATSPTVVIAHSLGSAVAYEALHATDHPIDLFVTLGSPLGARTTIQEILSPALVNNRGARPENVARWINIADPSDVVPLVQDLATCYDGVDADLHPTIGSPGSHAAEKYLRSPTMGGVLAQYLAGVHAATHT